MTSSRKRFWITLGCAVLVLLLGAAAGHYLRADVQLDKVRTMREQLASEAGRKLAPEERRERWRQLGQEMKQLTPGQRDVLIKERHREYVKQLDHYFSL